MWLVLWHGGGVYRVLVWDATCPAHLLPLMLLELLVRQGFVARHTEILQG